MKTILTLILGVVLGFFSYKLIPQLQPNLAQTQPSASNTPDSNDHPDKTLKTNIPSFNDSDEGQKLQTILDLPEEEFKTTNGNEATLFLLKNGMCKIRVELLGETYFAKHVAYFHKEKPLSIFQNEYRTSWMEPIEIDADSENKALYKTQNFNVESGLVQTEFHNLLEKFKPEFIKQC